MDQEDKLMMLLANASDLLWELFEEKDADPETEARYTVIRKEIHDALYAYRERKGVH